MAGIAIYGIERRAPLPNAQSSIGKCKTTQTFTVLWSIYAGWMPWPYAQESGILDTWGCKYGIKINLQQADYVPSIEAYVAGKADAVLMTNMDAMNFAGTGGIDSTAIIMGDYSNGNDAVITRDGLGLCDLKNKNINLVQYSVSHYLLARALETECTGQSAEKDLHIVNASDSDIGPVFVSNATQPAVVTWNPMLLTILSQVPEAKKVFDSSQIPYEILDIMFVRTDVVTAHPELARALTGAWYETLAIMKASSPEAERALKQMADRSGTSVDLYKQQLKTTNLWYTPKEAAEITRSQTIKDITPQVAEFSFKHGLYGPNAKSAEAVGVSFPDGSIFGDNNNVKIRYTDQFMQEAATDKQ
ncbi:lipid kinase [Candidatus Uhrbacteria bacterium]|nr:lipid kinase [Candidatus Uhrbacteria bacterium]